MAYLIKFFCTFVHSKSDKQIGMFSNRETKVNKILIIFRFLEYNWNLVLTMNAQINQGTLVFATIVSRCATKVPSMKTSYTLQNKWSSWDDNTPWNILIDQLTLEEEKKK